MAPISCYFLMIARFAGFSLVEMAEAKVNFISLHLGNAASTGYMAMVPGIATALAESSAIYPDLFENYTWNAHIELNSKSCGDLGNEFAVSALGTLYQAGAFRAAETTVIIAPSKFQLVL